MVIKNVNLETVCGITSTIPDNPFAEAAFAGKSNVGKSSLINVLISRKSLARTSSQPGKTQTINFYNVNDRVYLVDLPGYGYANANVEIKAQWGKMVEHYLHTSKKLEIVFLLVDIRHDPSENDRMMYKWIRSQGYAPVIIATKLDKIPKSKVNQHVDAVRRGLEATEETKIIPFSAVTKSGRDEIWECMEKFIREEELRGVDGQIEEKGRAAGADGNAQGEGEVKRKARWKKTGKPVAKKTLKKQIKKKMKKESRAYEK